MRSLGTLGRMNLDNRVVLIVGGANGIGRATAELCAQRGARVVIADFDAAAGQALAAQTGAAFAQVDVTSEASVAALFTQVQALHGRLDALVQTAGILRGAFVDIEQLSVETFKQVLDINLLGSFLCAKHAVPLLRVGGGGVIVLISSAAATAGSSSYAYGSSKGAVSSLGITLANKLEADGIRVNVVAPGNIDTAMKRGVVAAEVALKGAASDQAKLTLGDPAGVARLLAFLVSTEADYVRGLIATR